MNKRNTLLGALVGAGLMFGAGSAVAGPHEHHGAVYQQLAAAQHAHQHGGAEHGMRHGEHQGEHGKGHGGMRHLLKDLDLSEEQRTQIRQVMQEQKERARELHQALREGHQAMQQAATAERFDEVQVRQLANAQAERMAEMMVLRAELFHKVHSLLTPEQRQQVAERMERGGKHGRQGERPRG